MKVLVRILKDTHYIADKSNPSVRYSEVSYDYSCSLVSDSYKPEADRKWNFLFKSGFTEKAEIISSDFYKPESEVSFLRSLESKLKSLYAKEVMTSEALKKILEPMRVEATETISSICITPVRGASLT